MDAFVKAAREHFKDENIGTKELFKLMENGELLAKDILPLVGKYMSEAARKGGALEKMLKSNTVALQRLTMTWQNFQNEFFMGGFGATLTNTFNMLAQMLKDNTGLAKTLGEAFKKVANHLINGFTMVYDVSLAFWLLMEHYLFSKMPEGMKDFLADWGSIIAAVLIASATFRGLYGILKMIFGLGSLTKSLGMGAGAATTGGAAAAGGAAVGASRLLGGVPMAIGSASLYGVHEFGQWLAQWQHDLLESIFYSKPELRTDMRPSLQYQPSTLPMMGRDNYVMKDAANVNVNVKLNEGELKNLIDVQIQNDSTKIFNQLNLGN